ncbi:GNAT family N-acetyltransferase [Kitasatospora albolonga]|uniref:GNAT family N-acetyltransferase n=1 Tax=Kitasatospora albolonga TaxID=68173 RepID=UPI003CD0980F
MTLTWRRLTTADFPLLAEWLARPHVARWWNHETSPEAVERDFGPAARGEEPSEDLLVAVDGEPVALVQRCWIADYPQYMGELADQAEIPDRAMTLDYLIGGPRTDRPGPRHPHPPRRRRGHLDRPSDRDRPRHPRPRRQPRLLARPGEGRLPPLRRGRPGARQPRRRPPPLRLPPRPSSGAVTPRSACAIRGNPGAST